MEQNKTYTEPNGLQQTEQEIDLVEIIRKLWKNRKFILRITLIFMVLGVAVALFSSKEYTAGSTMVPQTSEKKMSGGLSGLAAMAGINLGDIGGGETLSPKMYYKILESIPFQ
ncbi:MAG: lipopolysaccharide biosynthesis protein, partial [Odoribacter sp.]|nr:lipopolysaccharide biosynthesis protein [Odoribacter sp.]